MKTPAYLRPRFVVLLPFSLLYGLIVVVRNWFYNWGIFRSHSVGVPVLSIGNLTVGGTGKTPMAEYLLRLCAELGVRAAYLSRGYRRNTRGYLRVNPRECTARQCGDEALQVALKFPDFPIAVCEDRVTGAQKLMAEQPLDLIVLDDAFQHRRIARNFDWVLIDANRPPWKDYLLPLGRLREPLSSLSRANFIVVSKLNDPAKLGRFKHRLRHHAHSFARLNPTGLVPFHNGPALDLHELERMHCIAFSGLGNNNAFFEDVRRLGMVIYRRHAFGDHHFYRPEEMSRITRQLRRLKVAGVLRRDPIILTTEKDYVRLKDEPWFEVQFGQFPFYYLRTEVSFIEGEAEVIAHLKPLASAHAQRTETAVR